MERNDRRPAHLHAGRLRRRRPGTLSRAEFRRHLHSEPPGLLRRLHLVPRRGHRNGARTGGPLQH